MYRYPSGMPERVKEECKHGCGIETGYRRISQMHPHTTSKNACQNNAVLHDNDHVQSANGTDSARQRIHVGHDVLIPDDASLYSERNVISRAAAGANIY